jgi:Uma2 family endonuclease
MYACMLCLDEDDLSSFLIKGRVRMTTHEKLSVVTPADWVPGPEQGKWTYREYAALGDEQRYEIVHGVLLMTPSPSDWHQRVTGRIFYYLTASIDLPGRGQVYQAPFDVFLGISDVVQPDVLVVLPENLGKVTEKGVMGAPDLVVEVASRSTALYDRLTKYDTYARYGVPEYWIVKPDACTVEVLVLEENTYQSLGVFHGAATLPSRVVPGLPVNVEQFFPGM